MHDLDLDFMSPRRTFVHDRTIEVQYVHKRIEQVSDMLNSDERIDV